MAAVVKFFFRSNPDRRSIHRIVQYLEDFGHGKATIDLQGRFTVLYVHDRRDFELLRHEFGHTLDAWAVLRR